MFYRGNMILPGHPSWKFPSQKELNLFDKIMKLTFCLLSQEMVLKTLRNYCTADLFRMYITASKINRYSKSTYKLLFRGVFIRHKNKSCTVI